MHKTVPLDVGGSLFISTHNGSIDVTTWKEPSADIDAVIEPGTMGYAEDVQKTEIRISGSPSSVRVESDYSAIGPHVTLWGMNEQYPPVRYTIKMPATARLQIEDHNASVHVSGLRGDAEINSHNGSVDLDDFGGGASIETHNGDIHVAFNRFDKASTIETHNGSTDIRLPAASRFHLNADGHHIGFDSEFAVTAQHMNRGRYVGDVNGGGPELRFTTHNGSLRLRKN